MARYETARIRLYQQKWHKTIFAAHVIAPDGERWIEDPEHRRVLFDVTRAGHVLEESVHRAAVDRVTRVLLADGWEPVGKEDLWYAYVFRRTVE